MLWALGNFALGSYCVAVSKGKCAAIDTKMIMYYPEDKTHFHKKGFALSLDLKVTVFYLGSNLY